MCNPLVCCIYWFESWPSISKLFCWGRANLELAPFRIHENFFAPTTHAPFSGVIDVQWRPFCFVIWKLLLLLLLPLVVLRSPSRYWHTHTLQCQSRWKDGIVLSISSLHSLTYSLSLSLSLAFRDSYRKSRDCCNRFRPRRLFVDYICIARSASPFFRHCW